MTDYSQSDWHELDADNTDVSPNGVQGGYAPSSIAPILRAMRGAAKRDFVRSNAIYTTTGTANAYVLTYEGAPLAYVTGMIYRFYAHAANTGAATLNVNGLGAKAIVTQHGSALTSGQLPTLRPVEVVYNGTSFVLISNEVHDAKFTGTTSVAALTANTFTANGAISGASLTLGSPLTVGQGGTGATSAASARTNLGLAAIAASGSASDLTTGTIPDARISGAYTGITTLTMSGLLTSADVTVDGGGSGNPDIVLKRLGVTVGSLYHDANNLVLRKYNTTTGAAEGYLRIDGNGVNDINFNNNIIWHAGNDGAGSTLDADLLDGQHGSYYQNASNLNAGTIPNARISGAYSGITTLDTTGKLTVTNAGECIKLNGPNATDDPYIAFYAGGVRTAYIQHQDGTGTTNGFVILNDVTDDRIILHNTNSINALKFHDNSVGTQDIIHTGNMNSKGIAQFTTSSSSTLTDYPVGSVLMVRLGDGDPITRNAAYPVYYSTGSSSAFGVTSGGALSGTWRARGDYDSPGSGAWCGLVQRVA
ncbi:Phage tail fiber protein [Sinorhizobium sojae CCBAU 05684]|uniref:Phage tail fiber protein n=1 Tax=Sinorhizobium sojae CCBAU 05684 TaxID=716928 RepID=A0A249PD26_9HYPH|nr:hypothetical protein [Sinorhizobium sojae]ASY63617.1 Phage tail fiber protein [Sinorhizobium sojae CCBAU 05684]